MSTAKPREQERSVYSRRDVIKVAVYASAGLIVGCKVRSSSGGSSGVLQQANEQNGWLLNRYLYIMPNGQLWFYCSKAEMGQGVGPTFAQVLAEDLEVDPGSISFKFNGVGIVPTSSGFTGGSSSMSSSFGELRMISATAASLLLTAGADALGATRSECILENGRVRKSGTDRSIGFGELAVAASRLTPPAEIIPKPLSECKLIGKETALNLRKSDGRLKVTGQAVFGIDVKLDGMLNAYILRNPNLSGRFLRCDLTPAQNMPGVRRVFVLPDDSPVQGVCVIAQYFYQAQNAARALSPEWEKGGNVNWEDVRRGRRQILDAPSPRASQPVANEQLAGTGASDDLDEQMAAAVAERDPSAGGREGFALVNENQGALLANSTMVGPFDYEVPYVPHSTMEPMNAVAWIRDDGTTHVWAPSQAPRGISADTVTQTFLGGGFGRRLSNDYAEEALAVAKASGLKVPIKLIWSRKDDFNFDYFRPGSQSRISGSVSGGRIVSWSHHIVGGSIGHQRHGFTHAPSASGSADTGGAYPPYRLVADEPSVSSTGYQVLRTGYWRALGKSQNNWIVETFVDELAHVAGIDPVAFRLQNLTNEDMQRALREVASDCGWAGRGALPVGKGLGVAVTEGWGASVGTAARVKVESGSLKVEKLWMVIVGGLTVNPQIARHQAESAVMFALTAALKQKITVQNHEIQETSFALNEPLRMDEAPDVAVRFVSLNDSIHGMGETPIPGVAPALCNAIFAATNQRIRTLPIAVATLEPRMR